MCKQLLLLLLLINMQQLNKYWMGKYIKNRFHAIIALLIVQLRLMSSYLY